MNVNNKLNRVRGRVEHLLDGHLFRIELRIDGLSIKKKYQRGKAVLISLDKVANFARTQPELFV